MITNDSHPHDVLEIITAPKKLKGGEFALVVVTEISGGTLRAKGALMAVSAESSIGYISAGCVDGDIIFQARECLRSGQSRDLIYGEGSPFKDIILPCGGSISVHINPNPDKAKLNQILVNLKNRKSAQLFIGGHALYYAPKLRLRLAGRGAPFTALANLALTSGFQVIGQSPDECLQQSAFAKFDHLTDPAKIPSTQDDPWTAVIFLFHDHDWEPALLAQALNGTAFYIGAMGSAKTHSKRIATLTQNGAENTRRIKGPIGLIPAMRDAQMLAISILAEIIEDAQKQGRLS